MDSVGWSGEDEGGEGDAVTGQKGMVDVFGGTRLLFDDLTS
jgi:hypothetical protein